MSHIAPAPQDEWLSIPPYIRRARADGEISILDFSLLAALIGAGVNYVDQNGRSYFRYHDNIRRLAGAPSPGWINDNLGRLKASGFLLELLPESRGDRPGRPCAVWLVPLDGKFAPNDEGTRAPKCRTLDSEPVRSRARGGNVISTSSNNVIPTRSSPDETNGPGATTKNLLSRAELSRTLFQILGIERVSNPELVMKEAKLNTVCYAVRILASARDRGEWIPNPGGYLATIIREQRDRPEIDDHSFLMSWKLGETGGNVVQFRRKAQ